MIARSCEAYCAELEDDFCYFNLLPDEMCVQIMLNLHPIYDDIITVSTVCKKWRKLLVWNADPAFWEHIYVHNIRYSGGNGSHDVVLESFRRAVHVVGHYVKILDISMCSAQFSEILCDYSFNLTNLQCLKIVKTRWDKELLRQLCCRNTLQDLSLDPSYLKESQIFEKNDFICIMNDFPKLKDIGLQYYYFHSGTLLTFREIILTNFGQAISQLSFNTSQIHYHELHYIVCKLNKLRSLTYGNDGIFSTNNQGSRCVIESESLEQIEFMNVSNLKELKLFTTSLKTILLKACTCLTILKFHSETLSSLSLVCCGNLRTLEGIFAPFLSDFKFRFCRQVPYVNFITFLERHYHITHLIVQPHWPSLDLSYNCCHSLKELYLLCGSDVLTSVKITAPHMTKFHCIKSSTKQMNIREIFLAAKSLFRVTVQGIPKLANMDIVAECLGTIEIDFGGQGLIDLSRRCQEPCFIRLLGKTQNCTSLKLKRCNLKALRLHECKIRYLFLDTCILNVTNLFLNGQVEQVFTNNCTGQLKLLQ